MSRLMQLLWSKSLAAQRKSLISQVFKRTYCSPMSDWKPQWQIEMEEQWTSPPTPSPPRMTPDEAAAQFKRDLQTGLRKNYGLVLDDLHRDHDPDVKEALSRLPPEVVEARVQRLKRAKELASKQEYVPEDDQLAKEAPDNYLKDILAAVKKEREEREALESPPAAEESPSPPETEDSVPETDESAPKTEESPAKTD